MNEITFEFACRDDCLDKMVPSDLRQLVAERDSLRARLAEIEGQGKPEPVAMAVLGQLFWKGNPKDHAGDSMDLYAAPVPAIPEGWQLVPVEPTPKMLRMAGIAVHNATYWERSYKAMLAAAPQPEGESK